MQSLLPGPQLQSEASTVLLINQYPDDSVPGMCNATLTVKVVHMRKLSCMQTMLSASSAHVVKPSYKWGAPCSLMYGYKGQAVVPVPASLRVVCLALHAVGPRKVLVHRVSEQLDLELGSHQGSQLGSAAASSFEGKEQDEDEAAAAADFTPMTDEKRTFLNEWVAKLGEDLPDEQAPIQARVFFAAIKHALARQLCASRLPFPFSTSWALHRAAESRAAVTYMSDMSD